MIITIDYDNDAVRVENDKGREIVTIREITNIKQVRTLLIEVFNAYMSNDSNPNISLCQQDEGQITTIEEY